jgi:hypothetical protein
MEEFAMTRRNALVTLVLIFALSGMAYAATLVTVPAPFSPGSLECNIVNVTPNPINRLTIKLFDEAGTLVGACGPRRLDPAVVMSCGIEGAGSYCRFIVSTSNKAAVRAVGYFSPEGAGSAIPLPAQ